MQALASNVLKMSLRTPPEALLRPLARAGRGTHDITLVQNAGIRQMHRAAVCSELKKKLQIKDVQSITSEDLEDTQVRVAVHAAGVNFGDILMCQGLYQEKPPLPFTPGTELAGVVSEAGSKASSRFQVGDRVFGTTSTLGAFSQECIGEYRSLWKMPDGMDYSTAAATTVSYGTAIMALERNGRIKPGETVLVTAAAGAVGLAAVDLAANVFGCKVIGACGGPEKGAQVKRQGASEVIDYKTESIRDRVMEITKGKGADIILDVVGGDTFKQCLRSIAFEGRLVVIGFASGDIPKVPANILLVKSISVTGVYWGSYAIRNYPVWKKTVDDVLEYYKQGKLHQHVSSTFDLVQANEAMEFINQRKSIGKVVIKTR